MLPRTVNSLSSHVVDRVVHFLPSSHPWVIFFLCCLFGQNRWFLLGGDLDVTLPVFKSSLGFKGSLPIGRRFFLFLAIVFYCFFFFGYCFSCLLPSFPSPVFTLRDYLLSTASQEISQSKKKLFLLWIFWGVSFLSQILLFEEVDKGGMLHYVRTFAYVCLSYC